METVTLRGEDFKTLHNTLCDLRNLVDRMERSLIKVNEFDRIMEGLEMGLKDAYDQDGMAFDRKMKYYSDCREAYGLKAITQAPHRHQSVALDLIIDCQPGVYTLVGTDLNADGTIRNPERIDWQAGGAFITPPGYWHSHVNGSGQPAYLLPIQDAGLQTYLRSLDIRFA